MGTALETYFILFEGAPWFTKYSKNMISEHDFGIPTYTHTPDREQQIVGVTNYYNLLYVGLLFGFCPSGYINSMSTNTW